MKNYFLFILLLLTASVQAQKIKAKKSADTPKNYLEVSLNVSGAIQTFVRNKTDSIYSDPYALSLKFVTHKYGIRLGAGYSFNTVKDITTVQARVTGLNRLDLRAGIDYQNPISDKWRIYYGADALYGWVKGRQQFSEGKEILTVDVNERMIGAGPIFGIQYHLNRRISFQTEAALYMMQISTEKTYKNSAKPGLTITPEKTTAFRFPPGLPRSVAVVVRF